MLLDRKKTADLGWPPRRVKHKPDDFHGRVYATRVHSNGPPLGEREFALDQRTALELPQAFAVEVFHNEEVSMKTIVLTMAAVAVALALPVQANAQGAATGAATGAVTGAVVGGPVGAAVGAGVGAIAGGIADDNRPRFRSYVTERKHPSYKYDREVRVGADLPPSGVTYYDVPPEYGVTKYRYTVVNERPVLVDPGSHRIMQVIE